MEQVICYCGGNLVSIMVIDTRKSEELKNLPHWPSDKIGTREIQQCQSCARLYLDKLLLIPWKEFGDERNSCPRCGNEKDLIVDEGRYVCLHPFCSYCWPDKANKRPRKMAILQDERTKIIESLSELADNPESEEFKNAIERVKKIKEQLQESNKEQL